MNERVIFVIWKIHNNLFHIFLAHNILGNQSSDKENVVRCKYRAIA